MIDGLAPRLIAVDLDGTLVPQSGDVPAGVADAVARVSEQGAIVVAATGRSLSTTAPVAVDAGMHEYAVVSNGAMIIAVDPPSVVETASFDATVLMAEVAALIPNGTFAVEATDGTFLTNRFFVDRGVSLDIREIPFDDLTREPVVRVVVRSDEHTGSELGAVVRHLDMHSIAFGATDVAWLDLGIKGINKATGLQKLCARLGIDRTEVLAIGDAMNDVEMLEWAGYAVAMGHASDRIKSLADHVTGPVPGEGVIAVLDRLYR